MSETRNRRLLGNIVVLVFICCCGLSAQAKYGGGTGEPNDPYLIFDANQMNAIGADANDWDKHFKMIADVNMASIDPCMFNPIGNSIVPFTGTFNGQDHTVHKFQCNANYNYVGLFGYVSDPCASISNVHLHEPNIIASSEKKVAAIIGYLHEGTLLNSSVTAGSVTGDYEVGGIVGESKEASIINCYAKGTNIIGRYYIGGLIGYSLHDNIHLSYSECEVQGFKNVGGLIGYSWMSIADECYSTGVVSGEDNVGGLIGCLTVSSGTIYVNNCYAACIVDATDGDAGGLIGFAAVYDGKVADSYWDVDVSGQTGSFGGTGKTTAEMYSYVTYYGWGCSGAWVLDEGNDYPRFYYQQTSGELLNPNGYGGGSGESEDPYLISSLEDLLWITVFPCDWGKSFKLIEDLNVSGISPDSFIPIGNKEEPFRGIFDGNGHRISNLTVNKRGLFGVISGENSGVFHLNVDNSTVVSDGFAGTLIGKLEYGKVQDCHVSGSVTHGHGCTGGLIGIAIGASIYDCSVQGGIVKGNWSYAGGLVGEAESVEVLRCYSTASLQKTGANSRTFGGLIGHVLSSGTIAECFASGDVIATSTAGGFIGWAQGTTLIQNCYALGDVETTDDSYARIGGFAGIIIDYEKIKNCYSTGKVTAPQNAVDKGGFVGLGTPEDVGCFWDVESSGISTSGVGTPKTTLEMQDMNTFSDAGWDFIEDLNDGPDNLWAMPDGGGYPVLWWQLNPWPALPSFSGGNGTIEAPYLVAHESDLKSIGNNSRLMDKNFKLIADINMDGSEFYPIGSELYKFAGSFDGNDHEITGCYWHEPNENYVGFFKYLTEQAEIKNLDLIDMNFSGRFYVGILTGYSDGATIKDCYCAGTAVGFNFVGGIAGYSRFKPIQNCWTTGNISGNVHIGGISGHCSQTSLINCHFEGTVEGTGGLGGLAGSVSTGNVISSSSSGQVIGSVIANGNVGGLLGIKVRGFVKNSMSSSNVTGYDTIGGFVGSSYTDIYNCYATGDVTGTNRVGGLVGLKNGTISNCYAAVLTVGGTNVGGLVGYDDLGVYNSSFWDNNVNSDLSGVGNITDPPDVIGESTTNMQAESTFTDAGWDFVGETVNGTDDIWDICEGTNYPKFVGQIPIGDFLCPDGVDFFDYSFFASQWAEDNCEASNDCEGRDLDQLGSVDIKDLRIFADNWLRGF